MTGIAPAQAAQPAAASWIRPVRLASLAVILASLAVLVATLPIADALQALLVRVEAFGTLAPLAYGVVYVVGAVLFVPGAALTIGAGALFGLWLGTLTVSLASTTAAALAFLIGRHAARSTVQGWAGRFPRFGAIDRAIGEGGWRVVALLRLSPAVPYSLGNYLYGLTAVRFVPYVLASWLAMLPGTFLYVYLGWAGREAVAAAGGQAERSLGEWILLAVGLAATVAVTVYVTRLALRAVRRQEVLDAEGGAAEAQKTQDKEDSVATKAGGTLGTVVLAGVAVLLLATAACAALAPDWLRGFFGPPRVEMREAYQERPDGPRFDHGAFTTLLRRFVDEEGWVDYAALAEDPRELDAYIARVAQAPFGEMGRDEKLALLINAYNAFTLRLILDHMPLDSIHDIPAGKRWDGRTWNVGGNQWTLNQIEHQEIRPKFQEPGIHWVLVCAAVGCPPLRREAYVGARVQEQIEDQGRIVHGSPRWFRYDRESGVVHLSRLYDWYAGDFEQVAGSVLRSAARYSKELAEDLEAGREPQVRFLDYDWALNSMENRP